MKYRIIKNGHGEYRIQKNFGNWIFSDWRYLFDQDYSSYEKAKKNLNKLIKYDNERLEYSYKSSQITVVNDETEGLK